MTEDADVGFHVYCMNGTQKVDVIPWERVPSHMVMEEGMAVCTRTDTRNSPLIGCYSINFKLNHLQITWNSTTVTATSNPKRCGSPWSSIRRSLLGAKQARPS